MASDFVKRPGRRPPSSTALMCLRILGWDDEARQALRAARDAYRRKGATAGLALSMRASVRWKTI